MGTRTSGDDRRIARNTLFLYFRQMLSFVSGLLAVPYNALIIAHERMKAFAYVGIAESVMKLGVACLVAASSRDRLPSYAFCMLLVSLSTRGLAAAYCKRHFAECRFVRGFDRRILSGMFAFSG